MESISSAPRTGTLALYEQPREGRCNVDIGRDNVLRGAQLPSDASREAAPPGEEAQIL